MNTTKFRGQRIDNKKWVYGDISNNPLTHESHIFSYDHIRSFVYEVIPDTVCQYIGIIGTDNEGDVEIYEHDIVSFIKTHNNKQYIGEVQYCNDVAGFMLRAMNDAAWYSFDFGLGTVDLKVIGNKYEGIK